MRENETRNTHTHPHTPTPTHTHTHTHTQSAITSPMLNKGLYLSILSTSHGAVPVLQSHVNTLVILNTIPCLVSSCAFSSPVCNQSAVIIIKDVYVSYHYCHGIIVINTIIVIVVSSALQSVMILNSYRAPFLHHSVDMMPQLI